MARRRRRTPRRPGATLDPTTHGTSFTYQARIIDAASNVGTTASQAVTIDTTGPTEALAITAIADDTGTSSTDFITSDTTLTVSGTNGALGAGEKIQVSNDGGSTWHDVVQNTATTWSYVDPTTHGTSFTYQARIIDAASNVGTTASQAVTIDTTGPTEALAITAIADDTGTSSTDFITSDTTLTVSGTNGALGAGEKIQVSNDGGSTWHDVVQNTTTTWSYLDPTTHGTSFTYQARIIDAASNVGTTASQAVTIFTTATVNVLTNAGYDLSTLYASMHNSDPTIGVHDSTHFTSPNVGAGVVYNVIGSGFTYNISGGSFQILSGTITALEIRNLSDNGLLVSMTGISYSGPDFGAAVGAYPDTTALDSLFKTIAYAFTGGSGPDVAVGGNLNDTFIGGDGNDTLTGGGGIDRALYTDATGAITVDLAGGHGERRRGRQRHAGLDRVDPRQRLRRQLRCDRLRGGERLLAACRRPSTNSRAWRGNDVITGNGNTATVVPERDGGGDGRLSRPGRAGDRAGDVADVGTDTFTGRADRPRLGVRRHAAGQQQRHRQSRVFEGRGGDDFIDGRGGFDRVSYCARARTTT